MIGAILSLKDLYIWIRCLNVARRLDKENMQIYILTRITKILYYKIKNKKKTSNENVEEEEEDEDLEVNYYDYLIELSNLYKRVGKNKEAIDSLLKVLEKRPYDSQTITSLSYLYAESQHFEDGVELLNNYITHFLEFNDRDEIFWQVLNFICDFYICLNDYVTLFEKVKLYTKDVNFDDFPIEIKEKIGISKLKSGHIEEAEVNLQLI
jgi:tetratricopeptide (TPR) repeat protein